jgi:hypothetical protein
MRKHHILAVLIAVIVGLSPSAHPTTTDHHIHPADRPADAARPLRVLATPGDPVSLDLTSAFVRPRSVEPTSRPAPVAVPAPAPAWVAGTSPTTAPVASTSPAAASYPWAALRQCESGDDYSADTGNGYYGAYQFTAGTWASLGLPGLPSEASPATQDSAARELQAQSGWSQWPACASALGLL